MAPDGRLWVAGDRHPDQAGGAGINVHDPRSLAVVDHADLPGPSFSLALVDGRMWVGSEGEVLVLDPATLELVDRFPVGGPAYQLVVLPAGDRVLAVEGERVELLATDGTVVADVDLEADGSVVAAVARNAIYLRVPVGADSTVLATDLALAAPPAPVGVDTDSTGGGLLATADGDLVLVDDRLDQLRCVLAGTTVAVADLVGVLAGAPDGGLVHATSAGVALRPAPC